MGDREDYELAIAACIQLRDTMRSTMSTLEDEVDGSNRIIDALTGGTPMVEAVRAHAINNLREGLTETLAQLDAARAEARLRMFEALLHDGLTLGDIARLWGISRQLAQRIVHQAKNA